MGFFSTENTTGTKYSPKVDKIQNRLTNAALLGTRAWFNDPTYQVAGMNDWQNNYGAGLQDMFAQNQGGSLSGQIAGLAGQGGSLSGQIAGIFGRGNDALNYSNVGLNDINKFANPLADMLNKRGSNQIQQGYDGALTNIANSEAGASAFAGSGSAGALRRSEADKSSINALKDMSLANEASAFQYGAGLAGSNADRTINSIFNSANLDLNALNAADQSRLQGLGFDLSSLSAADQSRLASQGFDLQALGLMGAFGDKVQNQDQRELDAPRIQAMQLLGLIPGIQGDQTTTDSPSVIDTIGTLLGSFL